MLNTLLVILWIVSVVCIIYFVRKHNSTGKWSSVIACVVLFLAIGLLPSNQQKTKQAKESSSSSASSSSYHSMSVKEAKSHKKQTSCSESTQANKQRLTSFAQAFGKPVDQIQRMPSVYTADQVDDNMVYTWKPDGLPKLVRVDSPDNFTTVYKYDKNGEHNALGEKLYEGRTIYQKQKAPIIYD